MSDKRRLTRRELLRGHFLGHAADMAGRAVDKSASILQGITPQPPAPKPPNDPQREGVTGRRVMLPIHRPPGAVDEASFLAGCTRCNDCVTACPVGAIVHAPDRFRAAAGTPMIDAHSVACVMCADTPCITACKPGVLRADQPMKMGVAWIQNEACLAYTGSFCSVCSERCPVEGAITVSMGKPRILENVCTGCGVCASVCPAPTNAVVVMPLADRPPVATHPPSN